MENSNSQNPSVLPHPAAEKLFPKTTNLCVEKLNFLGTCYKDQHGNLSSGDICSSWEQWKYLLHSTWPLASASYWNLWTFDIPGVAKAFLQWMWCMMSCIADCQNKYGSDRAVKEFSNNVLKMLKKWWKSVTRVTKVLWKSSTIVVKKLWKSCDER